MKTIVIQTAQKTIKKNQITEITKNLDADKGLGPKSRVLAKLLVPAQMRLSQSAYETKLYRGSGTTLTPASVVTHAKPEEADKFKED